MDGACKEWWYKDKMMGVSKKGYFYLFQPYILTNNYRCLKDLLLIFGLVGSKTQFSLWENTIVEFTCTSNLFLTHKLENFWISYSETLSLELERWNVGSVWCKLHGIGNFPTQKNGHVSMEIDSSFERATHMKRLRHYFYPHSTLDWCFVLAMIWWHLYSMSLI